MAEGPRGREEEEVAERSRSRGEVEQGGDGQVGERLVDDDAVR